MEHKVRKGKLTRPTRVHTDKHKTGLTASMIKECLDIMREQYSRTYSEDDLSKSISEIAHDDMWETLSKHLARKADNIALEILQSQKES